MGYRSQVVLAVAKEAAPAFMAMLAKHPEAHEMCFRHADETQTGYAEEGDWFMRWDDVKWYEGYEEVDPIQNFINAMNDGDLSDYGEPEPPVNYHTTVDKHGNEVKTVHPSHWDEYFRFVRVGEDYEDIETKGCAFDIYVNRAIDY
jgi:hypothetical protein